MILEVCWDGLWTFSFNYTILWTLSQLHGNGSWLESEVALRATLHLEAMPFRCVRGLKSSLVIDQKVEVGPNAFTPRGWAYLVVCIF
jgi:hypothetical protein